MDDTLHKNIENTLKAIVDSDGDCLDHNNCYWCPFAEKCLPRMIVGKKFLGKERVELALDYIARNLLIGDNT